MKKWKKNICFFMAAMCVCAVPVHASDVDSSVQVQNLSAYYITEGSTYDDIRGLLASLPPAVTGMDANTYIRIDKNAVNEYFYHVSLYNKTNHERQSHFFVAKDKTSVWQLQDNKDAVLVYGNAEGVLKKTEVVVYPTRIPIGSYGIIRVHVPGSLPYDIKLSSLNTSVASISDKMNIIPVQEGKTDIVIDIKIGDTEKTFTQSVQVVDTADKHTDRTSRNAPVSVGIGIGWGGWHHHGGGIGIGVGPWW